MARYARRTLFIVTFGLMLTIGAPAMAAAEEEALVVETSPHDVPATVQRLEAAVVAKGAKVVAAIDHAAAARASGLSLRPTVLVLFGNPKLGTPLMQSEQTAGLDLPLRVLVWQDAAGATQVGYTPPAAIAARHRIEDHGELIEKMAGALSAITAEATAR
ncbi:MAG: DUF302 domain-containing protein [Rhodospirillales bacterium]